MDAVNDLIGHVDQDIVVETTIDPALQSAAEQALDDALAQKGDKLSIGQGALVAMTPDGVVRALVGGRNYADSQFNRAIDAKRQPGSSFKPFVYLTALEHGLTPDTVREDAPISVKGWKPENYEHEYLGPVTLTQALANSLNTVSVRLTLEFGPDAVTRTAYRLGINSKLEPNASIALGTSEVSVARTGLRLRDVRQWRLCGRRRMSSSASAAPTAKCFTPARRSTLGRIVDRALRRHDEHDDARDAGSPAPRASADLPGWQAAGKTGTSQDFRDAWFIGYTSHLVTGVWLGNDDNSPTKKAAGGGLPVEIWSRFMKAAHQGVAPTPLPGFGNGWVSSGAPTPPQGLDGGAPVNNNPRRLRWRYTQFLAARQTVRKTLKSRPALRA